MTALSLLLPSIMSPAFPLLRALLSENFRCPQLLSYLDLVLLRKPIGPSTTSTIFHLIAGRGSLLTLTGNCPKCVIFFQVIFLMCFLQFFMVRLTPAWTTTKQPQWSFPSFSSKCSSKNRLPVAYGYRCKIHPKYHPCFYVLFMYSPRT